MPQTKVIFTEEEQHLLDAYKLGWDESGKKSGENKSYMYVNRTEKKAYNLGWDHFIIGDDVRSVDYLSKEEILKQIKAK